MTHADPTTPARRAGAFAIALLAANLAAAAAPETPLYATSFERQAAGPATAFAEAGAAWRFSGQAEITEAFQHTGAKSLHLFGGADNTCEIAFSGPLLKSRGLRFQAERWTSQAPFAFRVHACVGDAWKAVAALDDAIAVGARFRSAIALALPEGATALRLVCTAPERAGALIDDFALLQEAPMNPTQTPRTATEPIARKLVDQTLFRSGEGANIYRIPALVRAANGDLLAACDGRESMADLIGSRNIAIVLRRSADNGATWTPMETISQLGPGRPSSDPSLLLDRDTGEVFCFYNYMDQDASPREFRLHVRSSRDHGRTWSEPRDITDSIAPAEWKMDFKFITSGCGIQTRDGMLLHTLVNLSRGLHLFASRDHGKTWQRIDAPVTPADESKVIELADGRWMINSRVNGQGCRTVHISKDRGRTWQTRAEHGLVDPSCNAAIVRYSLASGGRGRNRLLFSNANARNGRRNLALRISYDEGETWSDGKVVDPGDAAYSDMAVCADGTIGILYEPGHDEVRFARVTLEDLTDGQDQRP